MPNDPTVDELILFVENQVGPPPDGVRSWKQLAADLRKLPREDIQSTMDETKRTLVVPVGPKTINGTDYGRWTEKKRIAVNLDAVRAWQQAKARGEASLEQRTRMLDYTGLGGITDLGVLPPEYPREYVQASEAWFRAKRMGTAVPAHLSSIMERVQDQYFTPLDATQAMWSLVARTNPTAHDILEPSAGAGRFPRTGPPGRKWVIVEMDTMLASMMSLCFPTAEVHPTMLEVYGKQVDALREKGPRFDLVIGNPPYGKRAVEMKSEDLSKIDDAEDYFTLRGASLLKRGEGTLAYLVQFDFLVDPSHRMARERMVKWCVFRGAAILPSKTFPRVWDGTFLIMLWTRREHPVDNLAELTDRDRAIAAGEYLQLEEAQTAVCGGEWKEGKRGQKGERSIFLDGEPDYSRIHQVYLAPMPAPLESYKPGSLLHSWGEGATVVPAEVVETAKKGRKKAVKLPPTAIIDRSQEAAAISEAASGMAKQVQRFLQLAGRDPLGAEALREPTRQVVLNYLTELGNPHPRGPAPMRAVVERDGTLSDVLTQPIQAGIRIGDPPEGASFVELVGWWSERRGYATARDLKMDEEDALATALEDPDVYLELRAEGPVFFAHWAYFTGPPAARLHAIDAVLESLVRGSGDNSLRSKLESQKTLILDQWASSKTLAELEATPRSPFVSLEVTSEWLNEAVRHKDDDDRDHPRVTLVVQDGLMSVPHNDPGLDYVMRRASYSLRTWSMAPVYWVIAYFNRTTNVENFRDDKKHVGETVKAYGQSNAREVREIDMEWIKKFQDWLGESPWASTVENEYNTKFAPPLISQIPSGPVDLPGQSSDVTLHPHQNQMVRRCTLGGKARPLLFAGDVGSGKTYAGLATAMKWYQTGVCRRVLITVPPAILAKWYRDAKKLFPDGRIGVIGFTPGKKGSDDPETRLEKWWRFAAGAYEITIVGHSSFLEDLEPDPDEVTDLLSGVLWARRKMGEQVAEQRMKFDRVADLKDALVRYEAADDYEKYYRLHPKFRGSWGEHREGQMRSIRLEIQEIEAKMMADDKSLGTDKEVATVQKLLRELVDDKPYRPKAGRRSGTSVVSLEDYGEDEDETDDGEAPKKGKKKKEVIQRLEGLVAWSDLGVDALFVDEAHRMKNQWRPAEKIEYAGAGADKLFGTKSPWDMWFKTLSVHRKHGGNGGVVFLTATPMTNSPLELYTLLTMVSPTVFTDIGIYDKEAFIERYWRIIIKDVVKPDGKVEQAKAVVGFQNLDELMGIISSVFDRKSTADLLRMGWLSRIPEVDAQSVTFDRDPAQTAMVRTLVATLVAWIKPKEDRDPSVMTDEEKEQALLKDIDLSTWSLNDRGALIKTGTASKDSAPAMINDRDTMRKARGVLRLIWMGLLDKVAIDPRLALAYFEEIRGLSPILEAQAKVDRYDAEVKRGNKPEGPRPEPPKLAEYMRVSLATALMNALPLAEVARYYRQHPVVPKVASVAAYIRNNLHKQGKRCGHIVFCDWTELHNDIREAIVAATRDLPPGQRIEKNRIAFLAGGGSNAKQKRLEISLGFNGQAEEVVDGAVVREAIPPIYDVVIGTSAVMAEGIDLQTRTCAIHHLDLPWQPAALHQRNGRAVRQGNTLDEVVIRFLMTKKTYDILRFDKVTNKAAWWDEMFKGQGSTSNPVISEDESMSLEEIILSMVIENEDELKLRLNQLKAVRAASIRSERIARAAKGWLDLNAVFEKARASVDPQRREALMREAITKRDKWRKDNADMVVKEALPLLNEHAVIVDWVQGQVIQPGRVYQPPKGRDDIKILDILVRPNGFMVRGRRRNGVDYAYEAEQTLYGAVARPDWTFAEEMQGLIYAMGQSSSAFAKLADIPWDLWPHALTLMQGWARNRVEVKSEWDRGKFQLSTKSALLIAGDYVIAALPVWLDKFSYTEVKSIPFLTSVLESTTAVLPVAHPNAWSTWVRALRTDRILCPEPPKTLSIGGKPDDVGAPTPGRTTGTRWSYWTQMLFNKPAPPEAIRQRLALTEESAGKGAKRSSQMGEDQVPQRLIEE